MLRAKVFKKNGFWVFEIVLLDGQRIVIPETFQWDWVTAYRAAGRALRGIRENRWARVSPEGYRREPSSGWVGPGQGVG